MIDKPYWYGFEVEGRYAGIYTAYVRHAVPPDAKHHAHVYFTIEYTSCLTPVTADAIRELLDMGIAVSLEASQAMLMSNVIPHDIFNLAHIMLRLQVQEVELLKSTDTVCLDARPYHVYAVTKHAMLETKAEHYGADVTVSKVQPR